MAGATHQGHIGSSPLSSDRPWPSQQMHGGTAGHNSPSLSTVPEVQQQQQTVPHQNILCARSLQPQRSLQQPAGSNLKQRLNRGQDGQDANLLPAERVKWSDKPVMSTNF